MYYKNTLYNNGYGCGCCRNDEVDGEWVEKIEPLERVIHILYKEYDVLHKPHFSSYYFEKDSEMVYGFKRNSLSARGETIFFHVGKLRKQVTSTTEGILIKEKELLKWTNVTNVHTQNQNS